MNFFLATLDKSGTNTTVDSYSILTLSCSYDIIIVVVAIIFSVTLLLVLLLLLYLNYSEISCILSSIIYGELFSLILCYSPY